MKCTFGQGKFSKQELLQHWEKLVALYGKATKSPGLKCWGKLVLGIIKIVFTILINKVIARFLEDF